MRHGPAPRSENRCCRVVTEHPEHLTRASRGRGWGMWSRDRSTELGTHFCQMLDAFAKVLDNTQISEVGPARAGATRFTTVLRSCSYFRKRSPRSRRCTDRFRSTTPVRGLTAAPPLPLIRVVTMACASVHLAALRWAGKRRLLVRHGDRRTGVATELALDARKAITGYQLPSAGLGKHAMLPHLANEFGETSDKAAVA